MEKLGIDLKLLISQIINFLVLFFLLSKLLYKPILKLLEERKKKIAQTLEDSQKLREELVKIEEDRKKILAEVRKEGEITLKKQIDLAEEKRKEIIEAAQKEAQRIIGETRTQLEQEKENMTREVAKRTGKLVIDLTKRIISQIDSETQHKILDKMIKDLR